MRPENRNCFRLPPIRGGAVCLIYRPLRERANRKSCAEGGFALQLFKYLSFSMVPVNSSLPEFRPAPRIGFPAASLAVPHEGRTTHFVFVDAKSPSRRESQRESRKRGGRSANGDERFFVPAPRRLESFRSHWERLWDFETNSSYFSDFAFLCPFATLRRQAGAQSASYALARTSNQPPVEPNSEIRI
jgi:hypothetical protein